MTYNLGDIETRQQEKSFIERNGDTNVKEKKMKSAMISELDMLSSFFIEAFNNLEMATEKNEENKVWYSIHMLIYTHKHIIDLLDQFKKSFEKVQDEVNVQYLKSLFEDYSEIRSDEKNLIDDFGKDLKDWIEDTKKDHILENHIFVKRSIPSLDVKNMLRHFDPETYELTIFEKTLDLKEFKEMVKDIKQNIDDIYWENYLAF